MLSLPVAHDPLGLGELDSPIPHARISALSLEHDDLGAAMEALAGADIQDELMIARLKKRRLQLREEIAGLVSTKMPAKSVAADFLGDADNDADMGASAPYVLRAAAPRSSSGAFAFSLLAILTALLMLGLDWSDLADSLNQMLAQIYLLSLLVAANG